MAQSPMKATCPVDFDLLVAIAKPLAQVASKRANESTFGKGDSFFPSLKQEVKDFRRTVQKRKVAQGGAMRVARASIISAMDILSESVRHIHEICSCKSANSKSRHYKLHGLFHLYKSDPLEAWKLFDFRTISSDKRLNLLFQFKTVSKKLAVISPQTLQAPAVMILGPDDTTAFIPNQTPQPIRDHLEDVYKLVAANWKCDENTHDPHTDVKLRLYTYRKPGETAHFELVFTASTKDDSGKTRLQESTVAYLQNETDHGNVYTVEAATPPLASTEKQVTFYAESGQYEERTKVTKRRSEFVREGLCRLISRTAISASQRLELCVNQGQLHLYDDYKPVHEADDFNRNEIITLENLILDRRPFSMEMAKKQPRAILQVILANAFLQLTQGPWLPEHCSKSNICFFYSKDSAMPDLFRPYLATRCCQGPSLADTSSHMDGFQAEQGEEYERLSTFHDSLTPRGHPYPNLLALGILLLEIELGQPIEHWRSAEICDSQRKPETYRIDADIIAANQMLEQCHENSHDSFYKAVQACITGDAFTLHFGRNETLRNQKFRQSVFVNIVQRLETSLRSVWDDRPPEMLDEFCAKIHLERRRERGRSMVCRTFNLALPSPIDFTSVGVAYETLPGSRLGLEDITSFDKREMQGADDWFKKLQQHVLSGLFPKTRIKQSVETSPRARAIVKKIFGNDGRVRVAVIDTGLDLSNSARMSLDPEDDRIKECVSFFDGNGENRGCDDTPVLVSGFKDLDGHGTHCAALIMRIAPTAELYVARVFPTKEDSTPDATAAHIHERVARAIRHAATVWNVDVISMSFGFSESIKIIKNEIDNASKMNIIMVAAPANWGGQRPAAWPACDEKVLDIYATDHLANKCEFSPTPPQNSEGFATIGVAVESRWPPHMKQGATVRKSGTSVATAIAAGLSAMTLAYMKSLIHLIADRIDEEDVETFKLIRTVPGMKAMFERMVIDGTRKRDGLAYLSPWHYLGQKNSNRALFREPEIVIPYTFLRDMHLRGLG